MEARGTRQGRGGDAGGSGACAAALVCGVGVRAAVMAAGLHQQLAEVEELATPKSGVAFAKEGWFLESLGRSAYDGGLFVGSRLVLVLYDAVPFEVLYTGLDTVIALVLFAGALEERRRGASAPHNKGTAPQDPSVVLFTYLLNPFTLLSCLSLCSLPLETSVVLLGVLLAGRPGLGLVAGLLLGLAGHLELYMSTMILPAMVRARQAEGSPLWVFFGAAAGHVVCWRVLGPQEAPLIWFGDLSPNIGLWWYFFTEVFAEAAPFFEYVFKVLPYIVVAPLVISLGERPMLLCHVMLMVHHVLQPYPSLGGVGLILSLCAAHPDLMARVKHRRGYLVVIAFTSAMLPVMRHMWLSVGSGNANYYYFQTLILQFSLCSVTLGFLREAIKDAQRKDFL